MPEQSLDFDTVVIRLLEFAEPVMVGNVVDWGHDDSTDLIYFQDVDGMTFWYNRSQIVAFTTHTENNNKATVDKVELLNYLVQNDDVNADLFDQIVNHFNL